MFSIIIPLYNKEAFIEKTLSSVLSQTFEKFEIIIINDGSTDRSLEVVQQILDTRIRIISTTNGGVSNARNLGITTARFDWVAFLDADDTWDTSFLSEIHTSITNFPQEKIFATGRSRIFKNEIERYKHEFLPMDGKTKVLNYFKVISKYLPLINSSNVVIAKGKFYPDTFFNPLQKKHEDHDLWMRLCIDSEVVFVNKNLSFYNKLVENSASQSNYDANDFQIYLATLLKVRTAISDEETKWLDTYTSKFLILTYLKFKATYTAKQKTALLSSIKKVLPSRFYNVLSVLKFVPYRLLKLIKR